MADNSGKEFSKDVLQKLFDGFRDADRAVVIRGGRAIARSTDLKGILILMHIGEQVHLRLELDKPFPVGRPLTLIFSPPNLIETDGTNSWDQTPEHSTRYTLISEMRKLQRACVDYQPWPSASFAEKAAATMEDAKDRMVAKLVEHMSE